MLVDPSFGNGHDAATPEIERILSRITEKRSGTWRHGGGLEFSSGIYRITKTIELPSAMGFVMSGKGTAFTPPARGILPNGGPWLVPRIAMLGTALLWDGPPDEPMIRWDGIGGAFRDFSLWGQKRADDGTTNGRDDGFQASSGIEVRKCRGLASGHSSFENLSVAHADQAFKFGDLPTDGNCADVSMDRVQCYQCNRFMLVKNTFGVNYRIGMAIAVQTPTVFDFEYGGCLDAQYVAIEHIDTFLITGAQGTGNGSFRFGTVKLDLQQGYAKPEFPCLVECRESQKIAVDFSVIHAPEGLREFPRDSSPVWDLRDKVDVHVERARYMPPAAHSRLSYGRVEYQSL